jgi:S-adenosylmethionine:tRNA ribosyltransferase-isomerase
VKLPESGPRVDVLTEQLDYNLPDALIARYPTEERDGARLLVLGPDADEHRCLRDLAELIPEGALLVVNDTRVRKARLLGRRRPGGGQVELLLLEAQREPGRFAALGRANNPLREGTQIDLGVLSAEVIARQPDGTLVVDLTGHGELEELIERHGHVPIPPYLGRQDEALDAQRYQTIFAKHLGSVAAPTAALHMTDAMLERLRARGVRVVSLTLHVGVGTFRPVSAADLDQHDMHSETFAVDEQLADAVRAARARGGAVVALGTTVVRALESAAGERGLVRACRGRTALLIQPGYRFRVVDALVTNFHMPRSTLLALVCAFAGLERTLAAYATAVEHGYRFLSYGDAMFIARCLTSGTMARMTAGAGDA